MAIDMRNVDGLLPVNKPEGMVSKDVSRWLVKRFGRLKLGHVGTLDPSASGVLPILLGRATRLQDHLLDMSKSYEFDITLGSETDTLDRDGAVIKTGPWEHVREADLQAAILGFIGDLDQTPPMYSAVKYKGKPLYDYARGGGGEDVPLEKLKRKVSVSRFELLEFKGAVARFRVHCSKGTYVRVLVKDVADKVGSCGTLTRLVRTSAAGLDLMATVDLATIEGAQDDAASLVVPIERIDLGIQRWSSPREALTGKLMSGQQVNVELGDYFAGIEGDAEQTLPNAWSKPALLLSENQRAFGIGTIRQTETGRIAIQMKRGL